MHPITHKISREVAQTMIGNTLVALLLWLAGVNTSFGLLLLVSQSIGLSIFSIRTLLLCREDQHKPHTLISLLSTMVGAGLGLYLAITLGGNEIKNWFLLQPWMVVRYLGMSLLIGMVFIYYFGSRERVRKLETAMREAELREATQQKNTLEAQLKLLQGQIEPHFLFNTLANLHSLIETDAQLAKRLLEQLNDYLRVSLLHTRAQSSTLGDECRLLAAYLQIHQCRMGQRLSWSMEIAPELQRLPVAPMLLQPLVENAIKHGLEPSISGGSITISADVNAQILHIVVSDTGLGLKASGGSGVGLVNIQERLHALYGDNARLHLQDNQPTGVKAELWIPLAP